MSANDDDLQSILDNIKVGDIINWPFKDGERKISKSTMYV